METKRAVPAPRNRYVEVKTNRKGWTEVEYIGSWNNGKVRLRLPDGQIIIRKRNNIRSVTHLVRSPNPLTNSYWKQFKTKKKRRKVLKRGGQKKFKRLSNKWKDPKIPKMPRKEI